MIFSECLYEHISTKQVAVHVKPFRNAAQATEFLLLSGPLEDVLDAMALISLAY